MQELVTLTFFDLRDHKEVVFWNRQTERQTNRTLERRTDMLVEIVV
jgi:hypothetical protein